MGWTEDCQKHRYWEYTEHEWRYWIESLPDTGFGRYNKQGWEDWLERMIEKHGRWTSLASGSDDGWTRWPSPEKYGDDGWEGEAPMACLLVPVRDEAMPASGNDDEAVTAYTLKVTHTKWVKNNQSSLKRKYMVGPDTMGR